jgi:hypothetical protein
MTHLKPRSATVTLYQGDDMDRLAALQRAVGLAERIAENGKSAARLGDVNQSVSEAQAAFDAFVDEAAERALTVEIRSIGRRRFRDLIAEHPPRMVKRKVTQERTLGEAEAPPPVDGPDEVEHEDDAGYGVNTETFPMALLCYRDGDTVTIAQPEFATKADVQRFVDDELAEGDYDQLWIAAYMLNRSPSRDPKALVYSTGSPSTDET